MCGVGGIVLPNHRQMQKPQVEALDAFSAAMHLRGPDFGGKWVGDQVGLVHRRLSIIDTDARSNQPMESEDWVLSYNGEIYNFKDIKRDLEKDVSFATTSDTEVLLRGLQIWGLEKTLARCAGMFAFLAFNKRTGMFYAVRDRLGIKPLFYTRTADGATFFASSVAALVSGLPKQQRRVYRPALASYFVLGAPFTTTSVFHGIERLEPAQCLVVRPDGSFSKYRYWEPRYQENFTMDDLVDVVREHQIADVKSALFLSGGVDSTFLASATTDLDCFHLTSPERGYAKAVAKRYKRHFVEVKPHLEGYLESMRHVAGFHGEPLMSSGIPYAVSQAMAAEGYKMAISANGADELFHGYPRTPMPEHEPQYLPLHESQSYKWFHEQISHIFRDSRNFSIQGFDDCTPSVIDIGNNALRAYRLSDFPPSASHRWFELMSYVLHDLNPTLDAASMANSLEVRVPFLDHRIVQGVLSWHGSKLVTEQYGRKAPLKAWLSADFPRSFFNRPKMGFSIDEQALAPIVKNEKKSFERLCAAGMIRLRDRQLGHHERDRLYLEKMSVAYEAWSEWSRGLESLAA